MTEIERIYQWRQENSRPILDVLHAWLVNNQKEVMPQSLIGKAISYALGQWVYIYRYIDDGGYAIDNNHLHAANGMNRSVEVFDSAHQDPHVAPGLGSGAAPDSPVDVR